MNTTAHFALVDAVCRAGDIAPETEREIKLGLLTAGFAEWLPDGRLVPTETGREYVRTHVEGEAHG